MRPLGYSVAYLLHRLNFIWNCTLRAYFKQNDALVDWVNAQPLAATVSCLGDGHDGIWNLFSAIAVPEQRREILDWYHLVENLYKIGGSIGSIQ